VSYSQDGRAFGTAWYAGRLRSSSHTFLAVSVTFISVFLCAQAKDGMRGQAIVKVTTGVTVTLPAPWFVADRTKNAVELSYPWPAGTERPKPKLGEKARSGAELANAAAHMTIEVDRLPSHSVALKHLSRIASEVSQRYRPTVIAGWPAIERQREAPIPNPGQGEGSSTSGLATFVTTAVVTDKLLVRFETVIAPGADPRLVDGALELARHIGVVAGNAAVAKRELTTLSSSPSPRNPNHDALGAGEETTPNKKPKGTGTLRGLSNAGTAQVRSGFGELEVAVSEDGQHVVVGTNGGFSFSDNGGQTFTSGGGIPCVYGGCDGDPSLAVGKSGNIYLSWIGFPTAGGSDSLSVSTDNGHTFSFAGNAVVCHTSTPPVCSLADQPHIAADRTSSSASGFDRVYLVWRKFTLGAAANIVCSTDSGSTWSEPTTVDAAGDYPRIAVGSDGSVYVIYVNLGASTVVLRKFSTCDSGLVPQPQVTVGTFQSPSACGDSQAPAAMPGLDRCNDGNIISSPTVTVDPTNAMHVYVAWSTSTGPTNEDVLVADSTDGGVTFPRSTHVNSSISARRFMPWACALGTGVFVSWYDRRGATTAQNDLTDYFLGSASPAGTGLMAGPEVNLSSNPDPQCATGWPYSTFEAKDATSCSVQPQLAGTCSGSGTPCSFSAPQCPPGETCNGNRGCPKYGDYNGNACVGSRIFTAWASATAPEGLPVVNGITIFSAVNQVSGACPAGLTSCSGVCVNTKTDPNNCGHCGNTCEVRPVCVNGKCLVCPAGTQPCCGGDFCRRTCPICP
jgi:hypothetical protein